MKLIVIVLNCFLVVLGLWFGIPSFRTQVPADSRSAEEIAAIAEKTSDPEQLRRMVTTSDTEIRTSKNLASVFREGAVVASAVSVLVGLTNIMFLICRSKKNDHAA